MDKILTKNNKKLNK